MHVQPYPNDPTGMVYTREELEGLVKVLVHHPRLLVVSDEVYNLLSVDEITCPSIGSWPYAVAEEGFGKAIAQIKKSLARLT